MSPPYIIGALEANLNFKYGLRSADSGTMVAGFTLWERTLIL